MPGFLEELKRRKVIRAVIAYVIVGWLLIQVAETDSHLWSETYDPDLDPLRGYPRFQEILGSLPRHV